MLKVAKPRLAIGYTVLLLAIIGNLCLYLWDPLPLQLLRNATFDQFQRLKPRVYQDSPVKIVDIDDDSLKRLGQWPWPRPVVAELIARLQAASPAVIALDMIFAEKDRTSPQIMQDLWPLSADEKQRLKRLPDHDQVLADALRRYPTVLGFALDQAENAASAPALKARFIEIGRSILPELQSFAGAITSLPLLENAAKGNGALTFTSDADGVIRKIPLLLRYKDGLVPSLVLESLRLAQNVNNILLRNQNDIYKESTEIGVGQIRLPINAKGEVWLYYSPHVSARYLPAWQVLAGQVDPKQLKNRILLIGTSAPGLMDQRFSALGSLIPGVEVHAQVLEQILSNTQLIQPAWRASVEILLLMVGGLLIGSIALSRHIIVSLMAFLLTLAMAWAAAWQAFAAYRLLLDPMVPSVMLLLIFVASSVFRHVYSERNQRWIKQAFSHYVSPNLVEYLVKHPEELELGGHRRICSFVFTDLTDFTALMESLDPGRAVSLLNTYLENMIRIALAHHGTLDRIVGDSVTVMFSAPVKQADHQQRAIQCALAMQDFASRYCQRLTQQGVAFGQTRIGVHSGEVIVGNFGGKTIFDYRALGDAVNTASRLEGANKYLGTRICVSEATLSNCPNIPARPIGRLLLKGKTLAVKTFEPLASANINPTAFDAYLAAYDLLQNQHPEATAAFQKLVWQYPSDTLAAFHFKRLHAGEKGDWIELNQK